jgi:predicted enzyme related to lactoylglutathione lyase
MVESLVAAGGVVVQEYEIGDRPDHVVMQDPEGNEFCVS